MNGKLNNYTFRVRERNQKAIDFTMIFFYVCFTRIGPENKL